jgi:hypothetical protein
MAGCLPVAFRLPGQVTCSVTRDRLPII